MRKALLVILNLPMLVYGQHEVIDLWPHQPPNAITDNVYVEETEKDSLGRVIRVRRVSVPTLTVFVPETRVSSGSAVIICPGGGYRHLAIDKEGYKVARWLNSLGVAAFVLKYRLPSDQIMETKSIGPLQDVQQAVRYVRKHAGNWGVDPTGIGVLGFSAGGHLAATAATKFHEVVYPAESVSARPDFSILVYPVISMQDELTHQGSRSNLLGPQPDKAVVDAFSNEVLVTPETPPAFLVHAADDKSVKAANSLEYFKALKKFDIPVEMHIFEKGGHGFGLGRGSRDTYENWSEAAEGWLEAQGLIEQ